MASSTMAPKLSWIGLGNMGRGMCKNIVARANLTSPLYVYNRTTARSQALADQLGHDKVCVVHSIREAVDSADIIFICVGDDETVVHIITKTLKCHVQGKVIVDCSTVHPDTTSKLAKLVGETDAEFVACPVFGAPSKADEGQLICVLAGPAKSTAKVKSYTTGVMGKAVIDMSDKPHRDASLLKLIGNTFFLGAIEALAQGHTLAEKSGLGCEPLHDWLQLMFPSGPYTSYSNRMLQGDYYKRQEPLFAVDLAIKDADHMLDLAKHAGARLHNVELGRKHLEVVRDVQGREGDITSIYGVCRQDSGLPFKKD